MFYSKKLNILFIASPKTGSTSVELFLSQIDPNGEKHRITLESKTIGSQDVSGGVVGHATAGELKNALGESLYNRLNTFGFVRHPFDKLVSSYFFNKRGSLYKSFQIKGKNKRIIRMVRMFFTFLLPKILPFQIWALFFPMKTNRKYFVNKEGEIIVDYIGRTEYLNEDLTFICGLCGIDTTNVKVPHVNKSMHQDWEKYFQNEFFKRIISYRFKDDLEFVSEVNMRIEQLTPVPNQKNASS